MKVKRMFYSLNFFIEKGHRILFRGIALFLLLVCNCNKKPQQNNQKQWNSDLPLAASQGNESRIRNLIEGGADVNQPSKGGWTPLHWAAEKGHKDCIIALLERGADINQPDKGGWTPFTASSKKRLCMPYFQQY